MIPRYQPPTLAEIAFTEETGNALKREPILGRKLAEVARDLHAYRLEARAKQGELLAHYTDKTAAYREGTASWLASSKKALESEDTPAGVLLVAARNVLGPGMEAFEPDTIREEFERHEKLKVPAVNYDKLFAATTLQQAPMFYFEVLTFSNTALAFNDVQPDADVVHEASPAQLAWAVYEAELILQEDMQFGTLEFDYEPATYTAHVLHRAGYILAPSLLSFAQPILDKLSAEQDLKTDKVREAWNALDKRNLASQTLSEDPLGVQLSLLAGVQLYVTDRADRYSKALAEIRHGAF